MLQAREMVADTLGYRSYENRSCDSGRVIAQEKGGKVNRSSMCAGPGLHFFTDAALKTDSVAKNRSFSLASNPVVKKGREFARQQRHTLMYKLSQEPSGPGGLGLGGEQPLQSGSLLTLPELFIHVWPLCIPPLKVLLQLCDDEKWASD